MSNIKSTVEVQLVHKETGKPVIWNTPADEQYFSDVMSEILERISIEEQQKKASAATETNEKTYSEK